MINYVYQLVDRKLLAIKFQEEELTGKVLIRPRYMAICHADQRYYQGIRSREVMEQKLPMALIHEFSGEVIADPSGRFRKGEWVTVVPNTPTGNHRTIHENYRRDSYFLSSGYDGFMREYVTADPDRVVSLEGVPEQIAAITEFVSVAVHAVRRFEQAAHSGKDHIAIWGDGSLAFVVGCTLKARFPESKLTIVGRHRDKLSVFSFADQTLQSDALPADFHPDHAFECCGGAGSAGAIRDIIGHVEPEATVVLMGVSENEIPINTRMSLERGLTFLCCSRSGRADFEEAAQLMRMKSVQRRLTRIVSVTAPVHSIDDIHRAFAEDRDTPFKTVFPWRL